MLHQQVIVHYGNSAGPTVSAGVLPFSCSAEWCFCYAIKNRKKSTIKNVKSYTIHNCEPRPGRTPCQMLFSRHEIKFRNVIVS